MSCNFSFLPISALKNWLICQLTNQERICYNNNAGEVGYHSIPDTVLSISFVVAATDEMLFFNQIVSPAFCFLKENVCAVSNFLPDFIISHFPCKSKAILWSFTKKPLYIVFTACTRILFPTSFSCYNIFAIRSTSTRCTRQVLIPKL